MNTNPSLSHPQISSNLHHFELKKHRNNENQTLDLINRNKEQIKRRDFGNFV
ncbi:hypothetical protein Hanom_Chr10g00875801 [Helianthus anomalus]